jgi:hypothetical protein
VLPPRILLTEEHLFLLEDPEACQQFTTGMINILKGEDHGIIGGPAAILLDNVTPRHISDLVQIPKPPAGRTTPENERLKKVSEGRVPATGITHKRYTDYIFIDALRLNRATLQHLYNEVNDHIVGTIDEPPAKGAHKRFLIYLQEVLLLISKVHPG